MRLTYIGKIMVTGKVMKSSGPSPKKTLGQHWLEDDSALKAICLAADLQVTDTVLEIGPGLGALTEQLVKRATKVIAVELDENLVWELSRRIKSPNLAIVHQDILQFNFGQLPDHYKVVANIPYYLTSNLIRTLSETKNPPQVAAILVQKEVAKRLAADPGDMSVLGVTAQYYWQVELGRIVSAELFNPKPKVDSQIVILKYRYQPLFSEVDTKRFFRLVRAGFSQKRKTLVNSLSGGLAVPKENATSMLNKAGISPSARAQTLSLGDWYRLYQAHS